MDRIPVADRPDLLPMYATPPHLAEETVKHQALAPYCGMGFKKGRLDPDVHERILASFRANASRFRPEAKIDYIETDNPAVIPCLFHEERELNIALSRELQPAHEEWSSMRLQESACYGIRVYQRGSYLFNHVDRTDTHIVSSTICVDHRLKSPWPLYIEDIDGKPYQVDMEPGEFVFFEGARLIHGRPYPLDGNWYAGMFVHYRPVELPTGPSEMR